MLTHQNQLKKYESVGLLILRITVALLLAVRQGWPTLIQFLEGATEFPDPLHLGARTTMGLMAFTEFFCAVAVCIGLMTRLFCIPVIIGFTVAVFVHHLYDPLSYKELPLLYWGGFLTILFLGPGKYSLDYLFLKKE